MLNEAVYFCGLLLVYAAEEVLPDRGVDVSGFMRCGRGVRGALCGSAQVAPDRNSAHSTCLVDGSAFTPFVSSFCFKLRRRVLNASGMIVALLLLLHRVPGDYLVADTRNKWVKRCPSASPGSPCTTVAGTGGVKGPLRILNLQTSNTCF